MKEIRIPKEVSQYISEAVKQGKTVGFVPTMGALHAGHLDLVKRAKKENDIVLCSIFVNPLQFNKSEDLAAYPIRTNEDKALLNQVGCDLLFSPNKEDLFTEKFQKEYDFGGIAAVMEGEHRPGHFEGVATVILTFYKLFTPTKSYYGEKDFQQLTIIRWLVNHFNINTEVVGCPTVRASSGLALSSRNLRLTEVEQEQASLIHKTLLYCRDNAEHISPVALIDQCTAKLREVFEVEYFVIADENTLQAVNNWEETNSPRAFVAVHLSGVRLIDNLSLIP